MFYILEPYFFGFQYQKLIFIYSQLSWIQDFPHSSVGKESTCNVGDPGLIPGSGRSTGEGIGYPLQYSWASLVAQLVKNLPAVQEIWVWSLGWEDPLEKGKATHSSILAWRIPVFRVAESQIGWAIFTFTFLPLRGLSEHAWSSWNRAQHTGSTVVIFYYFLLDFPRS